ncbi:MAG: NAD-dependent epimerase/dehydratase family protein [Candidatus Eisenbacteria bacterium]|uniref:NAD-dependent epimerase/dehydratase family protein n=1 Tax=Eiseniibacteriota bacterium TaxID=2212470 RepID=A0A849SIT0_UNCEI|nr:NAD-dependent epimerase/dehydratase family protein [Candidatus Eisenbacteria bacterium]
MGYHLARALHARGAQVFGTGTDREPPLAVAREQLLTNYAPAFDLRDVAAVRAGIAEWRPDSIVHLAAQSSTARSFEAPAETFEINMLGTWTLLEAVRDFVPRARLLVIGTGDVYGPQPAGSRVAEDVSFKPASPYAFSKAAADAAAEVAGARWGLDVVRTRSFGHTGPGQTPAFVVSAFAHQLAQIQEGRREPVLRVGNLAVTRDFTDVRDVVGAYVALLDRGTSGMAYNVCRGEATQLEELLRHMIAASGVEARIEVDSERLRPADVPYLVGDPTRIEREVGWRAEIPLDRTVAEMIAEHRAALASS